MSGRFDVYFFVRKVIAPPEVRWLFSSSGTPIAFVHEGAVHTATGRFFGCLQGAQVVDGDYVGEIIGNRLVRRVHKPLMIMEKVHCDPLEIAPELPPNVEPVVLESDFRDLGFP